MPTKAKARMPTTIRSSKKRPVFIVIPSLSPEFGGPVQSCSLLRDGLSSVGHGAKLIGSPPSLGPTPSLRALAFHHGAARQVPDEAVLHINGLFNPAVAPYLWRAQRSDSIRLIVSPRSTLMKPFSQWSLKRRMAWQIYGAALLERADSIHLTDRLELDASIGLLPAVPRTVVIPNAAPDERPLRDCTSALTGKRRRALVMSRFDARKRIDCLIRAWGNANPDGWGLDVAGSGTDRAVLTAIKRAVEAARAAGADVNLIGFVSDDCDRATLMAESSLFLSASRYENYGMAIVEAIQSGIPVLAGGATPWTEALKCAGLYLPDSSSQMEQKLAEICALTPAQLHNRCVRIRGQISLPTAAEVAVSMLKIYCG